MNTSLKARKAFADASFDFGLEGRFHLDNLSSTPVTEADHALPGDGSIDQIMRNASANFGFSEYINDRDARYMNTAASFQVANDALPVHANDIGWRFDERPPVQNLAPASLGIADTFGVPVATATVAATGDHNIDGVLSGVRWASTAVTFSFTNSISDYELGYEDRALHAASYQVMNATQQAVARAWIGTGGEYYDVSLLAPSELTGANDREATIRMAVSDVPGTAFAYYPNSSYVEGGDAWFNGSDYNSPVIGNYAYHTFGHELGHALGLKHGHETGGPANLAMNTDRDSMEFSIMTYRSYVGHDLNALPYYTNETGGFAQSLMMYDIAAIQHMYGAWFGNNSGNTAYTFSTTTGEMFVDGVGQGTPVANRIFRTIWDGGGIDTYNFSNYTTSLSIDLTPGGWSDVDTAGNFQSAKLNNGNGGITQYARGQVFNALQYQGDVRSLIENAVGGTGNDIIKGNAANNTLNGGNGNDTINAGSGTDTTTGGAGDDWLIEDDYINFDSHDGGDGVDTIDYSSVTFNAGAVTINLSTGISSVIGGNTETISNFENVWGSQGGETIVGSSGNNALDGKGGNDTLSGGFGNDTVLGDDGDDKLYGNQGNDALSGGLGNDWMHGGAENDGLDGGIGNDTLAGGTGNDTLTGGDGLDTADYSTSTDAVTVNLTTLLAQTVSASQGSDVLNGIENLLGGGYNDLLTGDNAANLLSGLGGNDTITGASGNDTLLGGNDNDSLSGGSGVDALYGGSGNDTLDGGTFKDDCYGEDGNDTFRVTSADFGDNVYGGSGTDTLDLSGWTYSAIAFNINLATQNYQLVPNDYGVDGTYDAQGIENVIASGFNDRITGNELNNDLNGGAGNDTINAGSGADTTAGGLGDDWVSDDDFVNFDSHDGGDGVDTIDYSGVTFSAGAVTINLATGISSVIGGNTEIISNFENALGSQGGETIVGSSGNNALDGKGGNDTLSGGFGNDTVLGDDGDDTLYGNQDNDSLSGGVGNDWMHGGAGNDSLDGGLGNDTLAGGSGNDTQAGGDGLDTADYSASTDAVTVNLIAAGSQFVSVSQGTDVLSGIENLLGGGYNDLLTGDNAANLLSGLGGNDTITGASGNDTLLGGNDNDSLNGGSGVDTLYGGSGNDTLDGGTFKDDCYGEDGNDTFRVTSADFGDNVYGGAGTDTLDLSGWTYSAIAFNINLATQNYQLVPNDYGVDGTYDAQGIENVIASGFNDRITGNELNNDLNGGAGNDTINAGSGADTTAGGLGDDWVSDDDFVNFDSHDGGDGVDTIDYSGVTFSAGAVTINLATGISSVTVIGGNTEIISNFENVWGSQGGETIVGSSGNNALDGKSGNDTLSGGFGNDTVLGGDGDDTLYGNQDNDSLSGGVGNDWMHGGAGNDSLDGGLGNDTLAGGVGNDTQAGGDGLDTADYSASTDAVTVNLIAAGSQFVSVSQGTDVLSGIENLLGGGYNDLLTGDNAANLLSGLGGNDTVNGGYGNDTVLGGDGDDTLYGNQDNDSLSGGLGNDWMHGGAGNDSLDGGSANDIVNGGLGIDLLSGGTGSDIFRFDTALGFGNIDTITDFQSGDLLSLSASIFTAFSGGTVVLGENLAYEAATGAVSYDADGAAAGAAQIFAIIGIGSHPGTLINTDFVLS